MNTDLSVAPEIAQLASPFVPAPAGAAVPRTDGRAAGDLADLAATPERWWDLVRFDSVGPVRVPVPDAPGAWLLILPPGAVAECDCQLATALAAEAVEARGPGVPALPLRPGRVRVHAKPLPVRALGTPVRHRVRSAGPGYSVTLHWAESPLPF